LAPASGCRSTVAAFGSTPEAGRRNAELLFTSSSFRFYAVNREPRFEHARSRLGKQALTPSRLYNDTSVWNGMSAADSSRTVSVVGTYANARYNLLTRRDPSYPEQLGDSRHIMRLRKVGHDQYDWLTTVEHAIGTVKPEEAARAMVALLTAFEGRTAAELRADVRGTFPNGSRALGTLASIYSLHTAQDADGATLLTLGIGIHPERLGTAYPDFAKYVRDYVGPANWRITLRDARGGTFFDARQDRSLITVRLRSRNGQLIPLEGPPRPVPDSLTMTVDFSGKFGIFRVGYKKLVGDFTIERSENEVAWMMRFRKEPDWILPLASRQLIRSPLRRPFHGRGSEFRIAIRSMPARQTVIARLATTTVQESAILRFLGSLGAGAMSDYSGKSEEQENRWWYEAFSALRKDV